MHRVVRAEDPAIVVRFSVAGDVDELGPRLRDADVRELKAMTELDPTAALRESFRVSARCYTVTVGGDPVLMFGVAPCAFPHTGVPWMLASPRLREIARPFLRYGREIADEAFSGYQRLANYTAPDNRVAHRWLHSLGFSVGPIHEHAGINGEPLMFFSKETPDV